jgi:hypothetical protein
MGIFASLTFFVLVSQTALAQCPTDPNRALEVVLQNAMNQREFLKSSRSHVVYHDIGDKKTSTYSFTRTLVDGKSNFVNDDPSNKPSRAVKMTIDRDTKLTLEERRALEFTPDNYTFEYEGMEAPEFYRYKLIPLTHREGLVVGHYWIKDCHPYRVAGNPFAGFWVPGMEIDDLFQTVNGASLPQRLFVNYKVRIFGVTGSIEALSTYDPKDVQVRPH